MKKVLFILSTAIIVIACGGGSTEAGKAATETKEAIASTDRFSAICTIPL